MLVKEALKKRELHFIVITHKTERVKKLNIYNELSLKEIALNMHYCSVSQLSDQFKIITGFPMHYNNLKNKRRNPIEAIGNCEEQNVQVNQLIQSN